MQRQSNRQLLGSYTLLWCRVFLACHAQAGHWGCRMLGRNLSDRDLADLLEDWAVAHAVMSERFWLKHMPRST